MDTDKLTLDELFSKDVHYSIPAWQRRYAWEQDDQWMPLWMDVRRVVESVLAEEVNPAQTHFLGAVVLQKLDNSSIQPPLYDVIDGQQRLATLQLLIRASETAFRDCELDFADYLLPMVKNQALFAKHDPRFRFKVSLKPHDRKDFEFAMDAGELEVPDGSRVLRAYEFLKSRVGEWLSEKDMETQSKCAEALLEVLKSKLILVVIEADSADDSNLIFETLNARGTPLLAWDMVRNALIDRLPNDSPIGLQEFDEDWWQQEEGRGRNRRSRIDSFLIDWLFMRNPQSRNGSKRGKSTSIGEIQSSRRMVFEDYRQYVRDHDGAVETIVKDLRRVSEGYRDVKERDDGSVLGVFLRRWRTLSPGAFGPVVLWLVTELDQYDEIEGEQQQLALKMIESYFVRRMLTGVTSQGGGQDLTRLAVLLLEALPEWTKNAVGEKVVEFFADLPTNNERMQCPEDDSVHVALIDSHPIYQKLNQRQTRMVLRAVEEHLRRDMADAPVPGSLTIEHLMPQRWNAADWPHPIANISEDEEAQAERAKLINTIGNLTLVTQKVNSRLSNGPWLYKRKKLNDFSVLLMNKRLLDESDTDRWDDEDIRNRSARMANLCTEIWPEPWAML